MSNVDPFATQTYTYELPPELIAQTPAPQRDQSRLLAVLRNGERRHLSVSDLAQLLRSGDLLVANDTRVLRARFYPKRRGGGAAQVLLLHPAGEPETWIAMARPGKRVRAGDRLRLGPSEGIEILDWAPGGNRVVRFYGIDAQTAMERYGLVPLPPYIHAPPQDASERYQTVYATRAGSVAAPTAGLHFTPELLAQLQALGIGWATVTLDVGPGTFRPVSTADVRAHVMHEERYEISQATADAIARTRASGGRVIAVGTTTLRAMEDSASSAADGSVQATNRSTSLFIHPPYRVTTADTLMTNFHLPRSTLLMLVSAFGGTERIRAAYEDAVRLRYRFYSFGDAMFVERPLA
ncbi:MAG: tRNA preQ1(34) S-adenosylmethionine ribosyltransferase-isomerase QueA [Candidatus Eremiobacteraeota bacterium]|nr:tRNA preQ1(34) S-adenosylmethionine ribosyltransferase-isomerase QueA [Candidatus Eremiobacteraeota bacterium]